MACVLLTNNPVLVAWCRRKMRIDRVIFCQAEFDLLQPGDCLYGSFTTCQAITLNQKGVRCFYPLFDMHDGLSEWVVSDANPYEGNFRFVEVFTTKPYSIKTAWPVNSFAAEVQKDTSFLSDGESGYAVPFVSEIMRSQTQSNLIVMFTDIEGFTGLNETYGDVFAASFRQLHDQIVRSAVEKNKSGKVLKFIGDGILAVFSCPFAAIEAAFTIQRALKEVFRYNKGCQSMRVRIGLHKGLVQIKNNFPHDVFGRHVNRASRITTLAQGGQILMSATLYATVNKWVIQNSNLIACELIGEYLLRGIAVPEKIYRITEMSEGAHQSRVESSRLSNGLKSYAPAANHPKNNL